MGSRFSANSDRLLHATGKLASCVYRLLFVQRGDSRLAKDISREWANLLREHSGQIQISSVRRRSSFDYAIIRVVFPELLLEVTRGRGEARVRLSPREELIRWEDLSVLLRSLGGEYGPHVRADMTLAQLGSVLTTLGGYHSEDAHGRDSRSARTGVTLPTSATVPKSTLQSASGELGDTSPRVGAAKLL
jgi:hypothetical protein